MSVAVTPKPKPKPKQIRRKKIDVPLAAALIASGQSVPDVAPQVGAKNAGSLRGALFDVGLTLAAIRQSAKPHLAVEHVASLVKAKLTDRLNEQADKLKSRRVGTLANKGQGEASTLKTMADTFRSLHGSADSQTIIFGAAKLSLSEPDIVEVVVTTDAPTSADSAPEPDQSSTAPD